MHSNAETQLHNAEMVAHVCLATDHIHHSAEAVATFMPSILETHLIGIGCVLKANIKIYHAYYREINFEDFGCETLLIIVKYGFIAGTLWISSVAAKFFLTCIGKGLGTGSTVVIFHTICGGLSGGYIGYKLGEVVDVCIKPTYSSKWIGLALRFATGIVLSAFLPASCVIIGTVAVSMVVANVLDEAF